MHRLICYLFFQCYKCETQWQMSWWAIMRDNHYWTMAVKFTIMRDNHYWTMAVKFAIMRDNHYWTMAVKFEIKESYH